MKKKLDKEEKQEKIKRIFKIVGCSIGLLLCGGAFIGLLFVGVRGCSATPRSNNKSVSDSAFVDSTNIEPRKASSYKIDTYEDDIYITQIDNEDYYNYVFLNKTFNSNLGHFTSTGPINREMHLISYINGFKREYFAFVAFSVSGGYAFNYSFYNHDRYGQLVDNINLQQNPNSSAWYVVGDLHLGDIIQIKVIDYENAAIPQFYQAFDIGAFSPVLNKDINFNNQINRYSVVNQDNAVFALGGENYRGNFVIFNGLFRDSNGQLYKSIKIQYANARVNGGATGYYTTDGRLAENNTGSENLIQYIYLQYTRIDTMADDSISTTDIIVNSANYVTVGEKYPVYTPESRWLSNAFQNIKIITIDSKYTYDTRLPTAKNNRLDVLSGLNNMSYISGNIVTGGGGSLGGSNPFVLIGTAFSSLIPFLTITIVPGITIGTLLLIPLIGMIVLFVVFLFKR